MIISAVAFTIGTIAHLVSHMSYGAVQFYTDQAGKFAE